MRRRRKSFQVKTALPVTHRSETSLSNSDSRMRYTVHPQEEKLGRGEFGGYSDSFLCATFDAVLPLSVSLMCHFSKMREEVPVGPEDSGALDVGQGCPPPLLGRCLYT